MTDKPIEFARMLFLKADHDLQAVERLLPDGPLDVSCFHAHQAVEKYLKAFLQRHGIEYPRTHDLDALLDLCLEVTTRFESMRTHLESFIPFAVQLRYEWDYEPKSPEAMQALETARSVRCAVLDVVPELGS